MPRSLEQYLQDVLTHSQECRSYVDGKTYLAFSNDERLKRAVERTLQIVGEAVWQAAKLDPSVVLWIGSSRQIMGLRHRLVHEYSDISEPILWAVVRDRLPALELEVINLIADLPKQAGGIHRGDTQ